MIRVLTALTWGRVSRTSRGVRIPQGAPHTPQVNRRLVRLTAGGQASGQWRLGATGGRGGSAARDPRAEAGAVGLIADERRVGTPNG